MSPGRLVIIKRVLVVNLPVVQNLARIEGPAPKYSIWMWSFHALHSGQRMFHRVGAYLMLWKPLKAKKKRSRLLSGIMTLAAGC